MDKNIRAICISSNVGEVIVNSYIDTMIQIQVENDFTEGNHVQKEVKQGYPLCNTILNLTIDFLIKMLNESYSYCGYGYLENIILGRKTSQGYEDDLLIFSNRR
jgi:hypothetical protein